MSFVDSSWYPLLVLFVTPLAGMISWWVRGYIEKKNRDKEKFNEETKQYTIKTISEQIYDFYFPMYLNLARYKLYSNKYNDFKDGHFSLTSNESDNISEIDHNINMVDFLDSCGLEKEESIPVLLPSPLYKRKFSFPDQQNFYARRQSQENNELDKMEQFSLMIDFYKQRMVDTLREIQNVYTTNSPKAKPDGILITKLIELDEYITYSTSFYENNYEKTINIDLDKKFPDSMYNLISTRLHYLQEKYKALIYEKHTHEDAINFELDEIVINKSKETIFKTIRRKDVKRARSLTQNSSV